MNTYVVTVQSDCGHIVTTVESVREFLAHYQGVEAKAPALVVDAPNSTEALRIALRSFDA